MTQEVKYLKLTDLVLWTENPRDPIDARAIDQDIVDKAIGDAGGKWVLTKLAKEMGTHYDFSELPTVVFHENKPVVYDGNRRIILGKIKFKQVVAKNIIISNLPEFPEYIPCNVCSEEIALANVFRKHADSGSWPPLERDIFLHKHMNQPKSAFLVIEEHTGVISANPALNKRFVKEEIFREDILKEVGLRVDGEKLETQHQPKEMAALFSDIAKKVSGKVISTRNKRGEVLDVLDPSTKEVIKANQTKEFKESVNSPPEAGSAPTPAQSRRTRMKESDLFGGPLYLKAGEVSNFYRDLVDLYGFYLTNKTTLSHSFPSIVRMALRLLAETAAKDVGEELGEFVKTRFKAAKDGLDQDSKTTLSTQNVSESSIVQLLQTGAHNYSAASNMAQSLAVSIILGGILTQSHGKPTRQP